jgi:putative flavoprotein involved in K+ transport
VAPGFPILRSVDVVVVGGGQAALALGYYLRRTTFSFVILDAGAAPGGAWRHTWDSLRLFSPARYSSLPGWLMPGSDREYPHRDEVLDYLARYEERYELPVERPVRVTGVRRESPGAEGLLVETAEGPRFRARAVVGATGTWEGAEIPLEPGLGDFRGVSLHSARYRGPEPFRQQHVVVVGGGNSGAQIVADLGGVARTTWATLHPPRFLPDEVDGRHLFEQSTVAWQARKEGRPPPAPLSLGDIVMVPPVREAREGGLLQTVRPPRLFLPDGVVWPDGRHEAVDAVIWATGFRPALGWLDPLGVRGPDGRVEVAGTRSANEPRLWLVGYGGWTGFASATLIGVGRSARATVDELSRVLARGRFGG